MAIVYSYPTTTPELQDLLIGTELAVQGGEDTPRTRTFTIGSIVELVTPALDLKANIASPTFTGTVGGITKEMVGLPNVDNTTDLLKPISTATRSTLDLKADLTGATFTGDINAIAFIKEDGLSTEYLMADGSTFTGSGEYAFPNLQQVTTTGPTTTADITANSFIKTGGSPTQFLKADGSIDSNAYITSAALAPYVPYTGAAANVNLGTYYITTDNVKVKPSYTSNWVSLLSYSGNSGDGTALGSITLRALSTGNGFFTTIQPGTLTGNRSITIPDASGTLALTSDIPVPTMPTLQQVITAGDTVTNVPIILNNNASSESLTINCENGTGIVCNGGDFGTGISASSLDSNAIQVNSGDGNGLYASTLDGNAVYATSIDGWGVAASTTSEGGALLVNGGTLGVGVVVQNGGVNIMGLVNPILGYQLALTLNSAAKPSTNTWTIASDERVKTNVNPYTKGLETILAINPITYDYNGKAGFDSTITGNIGIIAQDVLSIIPESINTYHAKLNEEDEEKTELYNFDSHALTFILINAVKQLSAEIELLKSI